MNLNSKKTYVIAEIGVNHNGSVRLAKKMIKEAKKCGADAVKFQSFKAKNLATDFAKQAPYQIKNTKTKEKQIKMLKKYELNDNSYYILKKECKKNRVEFISSIFDEESYNFLLNKIKPKIIKIPSGEITNYFILKKLNYKNNYIFLSTGMSNNSEIINALNTIAKKRVFSLNKKNQILILDKKTHRKIKKKICLMHCVTDYPVKYDYANIDCVSSFIKDYKLVIGYSDHTIGNLGPVIAISKGAKIIEKHFTIDKDLSGPDHIASLNCKEFKEMVEKIRISEKMFGSGIKKMEKCEIKNSKIARKSLVARKKIYKGELITYRNVTAKRPGNGKNPFDFIKMINKKSKKNYLKDQFI